jgi:hypothetical protein
MDCNLLHRSTPKRNEAVPTVTRAGGRGGG